MKLKRFTNWPSIRNWVGKTLLVMRLMLFIIAISVSQLFAVESYSQNARVNLNIANQSVKSVLGEIQNQSEFFFMFNSKIVDVERRVDLQVENEKINQVLDKLFAGTDIAYTVVDRQIVLFSTKTLAEQQQMKKVSGKVTDQSGAPIPGVSIVVKGTTTGITSDNNGKYNLNVPADTKILVFSFVGMKTQEVIVGSKLVYDIVLSEETIGLDEVVAIGYGTVKRSDLTGAVSSVKSETLKDLPAKSLAEALQGKVAGVYVTKGTGEPGASSDIMIRGAGSINGMGPLYVVDGVTMGTDANFNMSDVENIEILKDASSAAIYGIGAAGGVILVTTKKGKAGDKMHVTFDAYYGSRSAVNLPTLLDSKDYIKARKVMGVEYATWNNSKENTDWMSEMYKPATEQKYDLSLSGGNEKSTYFISAGYLKEEGIRRDNWFERYSLRMNSDHKLSDNLTIGQVLYINKTKNRPTDGSGLPYRSIPMMAVYDATRVGGWAGVPDGFQGSNAVGDAENHIYNNNAWGMEGNFFADWKIVNGLNLRATAGGYMGGVDNSQFNLLYDYGILKNDIRKLEKNLTRDESLTGDIVLTYNRIFGKHDIKAMAGWEVKKGTSSGVDASTEGFPVYYMPSFATSTQSATGRYATGDYGKWSQLSQFGRLNYSYSGKYLLQGTVRRDGTNQFIGNNRYGIFPSVSGAWKISEESFIKDNVCLLYTSDAAD